MEPENEKTIRFGKLVFKSMPEIWTYQIFSSIILLIASAVISSLIGLTADSTGHALSTGNVAEIFLTWRTPVIILLLLAMVFLYVLFEILIQICMCDDILVGRPVRLWDNIKKGFSSLKRFLNPSGIGLLIFVILAVPLCGLGFSVSLTSSFYIPNFIFDIIQKNPFLLFGYYFLIVFLIIKAYFWIFSFHGVLTDGLTPKEAKIRSRELLKGHHAKFIIGMAVAVLITVLIQTGFDFLGNVLEGQIEKAYSYIPVGYTFEAEGIMDLLGRTLPEQKLVEYHIISSIHVYVFTFVGQFITLLCNSYILIRVTRYYHEYSGKTEKRWPDRPDTVKKKWRIVLLAGSLAVVIAAAAGSGILYPYIFERTGKVDIIAHRAGGSMAAENSLQGLEKAIEHNCYGSEIDIQRTKDGYYVVNHDNTFKRLTGVNKKSTDMTLAEIKELKVNDTNDTGETVRIATLEEMLDMIKDKEKLFIEFKGETADEKMADEVVNMIRERDMLDDVVLISLKYKLIDYTETTYPEFDTGVLIFAGIGNVAKMNCDVLIMEEEMADDDVIDRIHNAGKQAIVWTVNHEGFMTKFLSSDADAVITDKVELAEMVQDRLDKRTDLQIIKDRISRLG